MLKKIGFTFNSKSDYIKKYGNIYPSDFYAEFDSDETLNEVEQALTYYNYEVERIGNAENLMRLLIDGKRWDMVFNIAEGLFSRNREAQVPLLLEMFGIPYTGSDALTMSATLDKVFAKKIVSFSGVNTPKFAQVFRVEELNDIKLKYPLIVKPSYEGTSKGLDRNSLVRNFKQLRDCVENIIEKYKQPALVEEFIVGKEFTVLVMGNKFSKKFPITAYPVVQITINGKTDLGEEFYTYDRVSSTDISYVCPSLENRSLTEKIQLVAKMSYEALQVRDFGRVDIRVDYNDNIFFLECNPLPNVGKIDVFPLIAEAISKRYEDLIGLIVDIADDRIKNLTY